MSMNEFTPNEMKATLQPRRPGENLKVAQTVLKRRDRNLKAAQIRAASVAKARNQKKEAKKGTLQIVRAEKLIKKSLIHQMDKKRLRNKDKKKHVKPQRGKTVLVARNSRRGGSKVTKKVLKSLSLSKRNTVVFMANSKDTVKKLEVIKPFVYWGVPTFKLVTNLVHKKATFKDPANPQAKELLSDNTIIERHLGDLGVLCTEDLAHALHTQSKDFDRVKQRLWPIEIGDINKANGMIFDKGYTFGNVKQEINSKISKLMAE